MLNYNGEKFIKSTIDSLVSLDYPKDSYEIIVVDNASKDKSGAVINQFKKVKTIYLDQNLGFAGGNNEGIRQATGKYILLFNNDCIADHTCIREMVNVAEKDDTIFSVGAKIMLNRTGKIQNAGTTVFNDGYGRDIGAVVKNKKQDYEVDRGQYDTEREVYATCGAAVLYRRSILDKIGFLDDSFFMYYEDVEIAESARLHGYKNMYAPKAVVYHEHAASSGEWSPFFIYHSERGRLLHVLYHFPLRIFWKEYAKFTFMSVLRIGYGIRHPGRFIQQLQYARATLSILFGLPFYLMRRIRKHAGIRSGAIETNFRTIMNNSRKDTS